VVIRKRVTRAKVLDFFAALPTWLPERGTIFTVVSKADGTVVARPQREPLLGIYQINCFERDDAILFDVPAYPEGRHISNLYLDRRAAAEALENQSNQTLHRAA
jgi:Retinal pigment epithelial membrane protein